MVFKRPRLVIEQIHFIGNYSLIIIAVSGLFVGFVLETAGVLHAHPIWFGRSAGCHGRPWLVRELGPVVTALLFAGRAGTSITAEIGLMKAGEQIAAIEVMGINPLRRIVVPRFWGGVIAMPILALIFSAVGIIGGWLVAVVLIGVDGGSFWSQMQSAVDIRDDILAGFIKSVVFGLAVMLVSVYEGWMSRPTPEGVARATTRTVVVSSLLVLALDFLLTAVMFGG
ncbi:membrane protein [Advenella kashmirensis WT001]|uniref:Intermembrane phospholipid transport system permease protein MlaE n=1 Tax=Advenella kashmirensis (strain DSM 17095 / LMG 22695 / WT001) TaxID=1036672 RepID=I3U879_ADVKW|nr:membrane protein [Advenella kashmirensis WT001]